MIQTGYRRLNGTVHRINYPRLWRLIFFVPGGWNLDRYPSLYWTRTWSWRTDNRDMSGYTWILLSGIFSFLINEASDFHRNFNTDQTHFTGNQRNLNFFMGLHWKSRGGGRSRIVLCNDGSFFSNFPAWPFFVICGWWKINLFYYQKLSFKVPLKCYPISWLVIEFESGWFVMDQMLLAILKTTSFLACIQHSNVNS